MQREIEGFKGIQLTNERTFCLLTIVVVFPLKFQANSKFCHEIYVKEHAVHKKEDSKPVGRTLFVLNIPPYATQDALKRIFSVAGAVESVTLCESEGHGFKSGYVVFTKTSSVTKALKLKELEPLSTEEHAVTVGLQKYVKDYNNSILDPVALKNQVDRFMARFDKEEEARKKKEKQQQEDEEGWTLVTKKGRNPGLSRKESVEIKIAEKLRKKSKKKNLKNFYTFQIRESKMNHIAKLREKFEEDKKRIEAFKKSRKFKPF